MVQQQTPSKCYVVTVTGWRTTVIPVRGGTVVDETLTLSLTQTMASLAELETLIIIFSLLVFALFAFTGILNEESARSNGTAANTHTHLKCQAGFFFVVVSVALIYVISST